jgi:D-alanyl-D-alanine carboxypeptidase
MALQEPIARFLPYPAPAWADSVTPHHLLCHTSGYQGMDKALAFSPGQRFSYSNQGYALLGRIVAEAQGGSYADLVARLFRRCGMGRSRFPSADLPADVAVGMSHPDSARAPQYAQAVDAAFAPAGGLVSTARDLWRWNQALHGGRLLSGAHYAQMTAASSTRPHPIFGDVDYGYGLQFSRVDGIHEISHGGYYPGFVTVNFYYPATQTSLVVLENLDWLDPAFKLSFHWEMQARKLLRDSGLLRPQNR